MERKPLVVDGTEVGDGGLVSLIMRTAKVHVLSSGRNLARSVDMEGPSEACHGVQMESI